MISLLDAGIRAADDLLLFALEPVLKAREKAPTIDILSLAGFDRFVLGLLDAMLRVAEPVERKAVGAMLRQLDKDWPKLTPEQRSAAIRAAGEAYLGISTTQGPRIGEMLREAGADAHKLTMQAASEQHDLHITPHLAAIDRRVIDAAAQANALFVRDEAGKRSELLSIRARNVVASGLEQGFDGATIAEMLGQELAGTAGRQNKAYLRIVADAMTGRARSYATLRSFEEAEITSYRWSSVLDEVSTEFCRMMDGRVFEVRHAIQRFAEAATASATEPEAVKRLQPWVALGKDDSGAEVLYAKVGGERQIIATVDEPGRGVADKRGGYTQRIDDAGLVKLGVTTPPAHAHCRSALLPTTMSGGVAAVPASPADRASNLEEPPPPAADLAPQTLDDLPRVVWPDAFRQRAAALPTGESEESFKRRAKAALDRLPADTRRTITDYTGQDYARIRHGEARTDEELRSDGWTAAKIELVRAQIRALDAASAASFGEEMVVFRGLKRLDRSTVDAILGQAEFELGKDGGRGTASTSWDPHVAIDRFMDGFGDHNAATGKLYKVLFVLRQRSGIAVQTISEMREEREILVSRGVRFRTLSRTRVNDRTVIIEAEEVGRAER